MISVDASSVHILLKIAIVVNILFIKILFLYFHLHVSLPFPSTYILKFFSLPKFQPKKLAMEEPEDGRAHAQTAS